MIPLKSHQAPDEHPVVPDKKPVPDNHRGRTHGPPLKEPDIGKMPPRRDPPPAPQPGI